MCGAFYSQYSHQRVSAGIPAIRLELVPAKWNYFQAVHRTDYTQLLHSGLKTHHTTASVTIQSWRPRILIIIHS